MVDVSKLKALKKTSALGEPPSMEEASTNLDAPETAPSAPLDLSPILKRKIDGRSARRTNRTVQFATRVTPEWDVRIRSLAQKEGVLLVEILERALCLYEDKKK
jgi:hypothetical protein